MTESNEGSEPTALEEVLGAFKSANDNADDPNVENATGTNTGLTWSSVTEADEPSAPTPSATEQNFRFDLGGALARLSGDEHEAPADTVSAAASAPASEAPAATPEPAPAAEHVASPESVEPTVAPDPLESLRRTLDEGAPATVHETAAPVEAAAAPAPVEYESSPTKRASTVSSPVFDDLPSRSPAPETVLPAAHTAPVQPVPREPASVPSQQSQAREMPTSVFQTEDAAAGGPTLPVDPGVPMLPASNPAAPPPVVEAVGTAPSSPGDITALRSAQLRASRQQRQGKLFGRSLLAIVLIGGLLAAALVFGRSILFSTEWDAELTPLVNQVQDSRGADFDGTINLNTLGGTEYGERLLARTIGDTWTERVPQWRALGLATGTLDAPAIASALAQSTPAFYDADSGEIVQLAGVAPELAEPHLLRALESGFDDQNGLLPESSYEPAESGFVGVSTEASIATRAVDHFLMNRTQERQVANEALPLPIAYELAAVEALGEPILLASGTDPAEVSAGDTYPEAVATSLDDAPTRTASGLLRPGESPLVDPTALGIDDWSLVWSTRLPDTTVARLANIVTADSYRAVDRGGVVCFVGVFETASALNGSSVFTSMLTWASNAPAASQALATQLGEQRIQLEACDPGADATVAPNPGGVDALIDRQFTRITN